MKTDAKICVGGVGAVGGLLAAMLGKGFENLSLIARGPRAQALRAGGVALHSQFYGEVTARPRAVAETGAEIGVQDYIFVCVKNYSLDQIIATLGPAVGADTVLIPVMNGIEAGDRLREAFPRATVCDGVIYTISGANPDYSVTQTGGYTHLFLGSKEGSERARAAAGEVYEMLRRVGFDVRLSEDIRRDIWEKFILNCAYNTLTARHRTTTGRIRESEALRADVRSLLSEAYRIGVLEGVPLPEDLVEQKYAFIMEKQADSATSSMARDVEARRPVEMDAFSGAILRAARRHGVEVPVTRRYHQELAELVASYR